MNILKISPSIICADFLNLKKDLDILIAQKIDYIHIDIMDGHYVCNFAMGLDFCKALNSYADIPLDIHLMIENVDEFIPDFAQFKNCIISFHPEVCYHPMRTIQLIKSYSARAGIAINPVLQIESIKYLLPDIDIISIMTVHPGFASQKIIPGSLEKLREIVNYIHSRGYSMEIEVDGNVSWQNLLKMRDAGAQVFVAGTSSIFEKGGDLRKNIMRFRSILKGVEKD